MLSRILSALLVPSLLFSSFAQAEVDTSSVGPLTPLSSKSTICNVLDYGAVADNSTDIGLAILSAFTSCAKAGGATLYIPPGSYSIATGVVLNGGSAYAIQIDGLITLTSDGSFNGNAIVIENASDVEVFSSNALGAINGQGYIERITSSGQNARLFRFISCSDISIHDMIFVDSPTFHLVFNEVSNMEAYHITVRGPDLGGTDGVDVTCTDNCYMHDIEVTNRDECISVKSPSNNILIEDIYCNQSGGMSIGSLTADITDSSDAAALSNITMRNIYIFQCTQMLMIKTFPGGTGAEGYVKDSVFENFWAYDTTYALEIDQYWESTTTPDTGAVALSSLTFSNWTGTMDNGAERGAIVIRGSDIVPAVDISLEDFDMWTVNGNKVINQCKNVYGTGYCAGTSTAASLTTFTTSVTSTVAPTGFVTPTSPAWGISGYGTTDPIPVYTPAVFWSPASSGVASTTASADGAVSASASVAKSTAASSSLKTSSVVKVVSTSASLPTSIGSSIEASSSSSLAVTSSLELSTSLSTPTPTTLLAVPSSASTILISSPSISTGRVTRTRLTHTPRPMSTGSSVVDGQGGGEDGESCEW
ncbi:pectin lyase-like protein [Mollisia scopiformis]|uniref:Pectin lyase-like protein n=1 Tax=Mollisia scopiformis TaxID=149040 RepID=A0A194XVI9_MOLSC|nr:pectin lyase-like protein [Mollisia scopiformis]KUJ23727.1 pectin lyase-like protein [Mollisia scopiformis]